MSNIQSIKGQPESAPSIPSAFRRPPPISHLPPHPPSLPVFSTSVPMPRTSTAFGSGWEGSVLESWAAKNPEDTYAAGMGVSRMADIEGRYEPGFDCLGQLAALQAKLDRQLGPEYLQSRPGPGGSKFTYIEGWKVINIANEIFGFNGWSHSIVNMKTEYLDQDPSSGRFSAGVTALVRVTLRDGTFHEDSGWGGMNNAQTKGDALEKCNKEAATDALKRALRSFGNLMGNCLYDKDYLVKVKNVKATPARFDVKALYRRPDLDTHNSRANIVSDPINPPQKVYPPSHPVEQAQHQKEYLTAAAAARNQRYESQTAIAGREEPPDSARSTTVNQRVQSGSAVGPSGQSTHTISGTGSIQGQKVVQDESMLEEMEIPPSSLGDTVFEDYDLTGVNLDMSDYESGGLVGGQPITKDGDSKKDRHGVEQEKVGLQNTNKPSVVINSRQPASIASVPGPRQQQQQPQTTATNNISTKPLISTTTTSVAPSHGSRPIAGISSGGKALGPGFGSKVGGFNFTNAPGGNSAVQSTVLPRPGVNASGAWKRAQSLASLGDTKITTDGTPRISSTTPTGSSTTPTGPNSHRPVYPIVPPQPQTNLYSNTGTNTSSNFITNTTLNTNTNANTNTTHRRSYGELDTIPGPGQESGQQTNTNMHAKKPKIEYHPHP